MRVSKRTDGGVLNRENAERNEYNVNMPDKTFGEPFVIKLQMRVGQENREKIYGCINLEYFKMFFVLLYFS